MNGDKLVTSLDLLLLINELNRRATSGTVGNGEGSPEGEQVVPSEPADKLDEEGLTSKSKLSPLGPGTGLSPNGHNGLKLHSSDNASNGPGSPTHVERIDF